MNDEIGAARRRKRRRYHIKRLGIFLCLLALLLAGVVVANAITKTTFSDIADFAATVFSGGGYPAPLGDSRPLKVRSMSMSYAVLTEDELLIQSGRGGSLLRVDHGHVGADIEAAGNRVALYNIGSRDVAVYNRTRLIASFKTEGAIIDGAMGGDGTLALLTGSERYFCQLEVYSNGLYEKRMTWYGAGGFPLSCALSQSGNRAAVGCIDTEGGAIVTELTMVDVGGATQLYAVRVPGLLLDMMITQDDGILAVTDEGAFRLSPEGAVRASVDFAGTPVLYIRFGEGSLAVAFGDNNQPAVNYLRLFSDSLDERYTAEGCGRIRDIYISGRTVYTLGDGEIRRYSSSGEVEQRYQADRDAFQLIDYYGMIELRPDEAVRIAKPMEEE